MLLLRCVPLGCRRPHPTLSSFILLQVRFFFFITSWASFPIRKFVSHFSSEINKSPSSNGMLKMSREGKEREAKRRAGWRNYLWVAEAGGIGGSVAHGRHSHSLRTNSQLSVTSSRAQALSATFIIQAQPFLGS